MENQDNQGQQRPNQYSVKDRMNMAYRNALQNDNVKRFMPNFDWYFVIGLVVILAVLGGSWYVLQSRKNANEVELSMSGATPFPKVPPSITPSPTMGANANDGSPRSNLDMGNTSKGGSSTATPATKGGLTNPSTLPQTGFPTWIMLIILIGAIFGGFELRRLAKRINL